MKKKIFTFLIHWYSTGDKPLPRWLQRVCDNNVQLGWVRDDARSMTRQLGSESPPCRDTSSSDLVARIMENIDEKPGTPSPRSSSFLKPLAIAAVACVAFFLSWQLTLKDRSNGNLEPAVAQHQSEGVSEEGNLVVAAEILPEGGQWVNPLDQEIEYVLQDARGAIGFLAKNFLPSEVFANLNTKGSKLNGDS